MALMRGRYRRMAGEVATARLCGTRFGTRRRLRSAEPAADPLHLDALQDTRLRRDRSRTPGRGRARAAMPAVRKRRPAFEEAENRDHPGRCPQHRFQNNLPHLARFDCDTLPRYPEGDRPSTRGHTPRRGYPRAVAHEPHIERLPKLR